MFKELFKQSWQVTWRHPVLWFFGLCNVFLVGNELNLIINNFSRFGKNIEALLKNRGINQAITNFEFIRNIFSQSNFINLAIFFIPVIVLFCLAVIAQIILIRGIRLAKDNQKFTISQLFRISSRQFWAIFFLNLINPLVIYLLLAAFSLPFNYLYQKFGHLTWLIIYSVLDLIIFIPLSLIISFVARFAVFDLIIYQNKLLLGVKNAFLFFFKNWAKTIWLVAILTLIGLGAGIALFILTSTSSIPFIIFAFIFLKFKILAGFWFVLGLGMVVIVILFFFLGSIFSTFQTVSWVLFYSEKLGKKGE